MGTVDLIHGPLHLMILKTLSWGPMHGYDIARWIRQTTDDVLQIEEGSLYPALHWMEERGWVKGTWGVSDNNRRARFYCQTRAGRLHLQRESKSWRLYSEAVGKVLHSRRQPAF